MRPHHVIVRQIKINTFFFSRTRNYTVKHYVSVLQEFEMDLEKCGLCGIFGVATCSYFDICALVRCPVGAVNIKGYI